MMFRKLRCRLLKPKRPEMFVQLLIMLRVEFLRKMRLRWTRNDPFRIPRVSPGRIRPLHILSALKVLLHQVFILPFQLDHPLEKFVLDFIRVVAIIDLWWRSVERFRALRTGLLLLGFLQSLCLGITQVVALGLILVITTVTSGRCGSLSSSPSTLLRREKLIVVSCYITWIKIFFLIAQSFLFGSRHALLQVYSLFL